MNGLKNFHGCFCNRDMDIDVVDNGNGSFSIFYTVKDAGEYTLNIKFGGQPVPGGFYTFTVSAIFLCVIIFALTNRKLGKSSAVSHISTYGRFFQAFRAVALVVG